jgi:hypothetical protein
MVFVQILQLSNACDQIINLNGHAVYMALHLARQAINTDKLSIADIQCCFGLPESSKSTRLNRLPFKA